MAQSDADRKLTLLRELAKELGVQLNEKSEKKRGEDFRAQRFQALAGIAEKFDDIMSGSGKDQYIQASETLVDEYWEKYTNRTEKSKKGGTPNGYKQVIRLGRDAGKLFDRLQRRIDHWKSEKNRNIIDEDSESREKRIALADRYVHIRDPKKHIGRPGRIINGIVISNLSGGTTRDSLSWEVARLFSEYGDRVLDDDVLDAILDNGGASSASQANYITLSDLVAQCEKAVNESALRPEQLSLVRQALAILTQGLSRSER